MTDAQLAALARHGYDPDALPSGMSGGPGAPWRGTGGVLLRNRVCYLDGVKIDEHEFDLDSGGGCLHCGKSWDEIDDLDPEEDE